GRLALGPEGARRVLDLARRIFGRKAWRSPFMCGDSAAVEGKEKGRGPESGAAPPSDRWADYSPPNLLKLYTASTPSTIWSGESSKPLLLLFWKNSSFEPSSLSKRSCRTAPRTIRAA